MRPLASHRTWPTTALLLALGLAACKSEPDRPGADIELGDSGQACLEGFIVYLVERAAGDEPLRTLAAPAGWFEGPSAPCGAVELPAEQRGRRALTALLAVAGHPDYQSSDESTGDIALLAGTSAEGRAVAALSVALHTREATRALISGGVARGHEAFTDFHSRYAAMLMGESVDDITDWTGAPWTGTQFVPRALLERYATHWPEGAVLLVTSRRDGSEAGTLTATAAQLAVDRVRALPQCLGLFRTLATAARTEPVPDSEDPDYDTDHFTRYCTGAREGRPLSSREQDHLDELYADPVDPQTLTLPRVDRRLDALPHAPVVWVTPSAVAVDGSRVVDLPAGRAPTSEQLAPLGERLRSISDQMAAGGGQALAHMLGGAPTDVTIALDRRVGSPTAAAILRAMDEAGFSDIELALQQEGGVGAIPVTLAPRRAVRVEVPAGGLAATTARFLVEGPAQAATADPQVGTATLVLAPLPLTTVEPIAATIALLLDSCEAVGIDCLLAWSLEDPSSRPRAPQVP